MIVVTGGSGFVGSNLVSALNARGRDDVLVADELQDGRKLLNLADCDVLDVVDKDTFLADLEAGRLRESIDVLFHQGACAVTTEWDGRAMLETNTRYSQRLLEVALQGEVPFIYASSASVYGAGRGFSETREHESPLNPYAYSKFLFDSQVRRALAKKPGSQVVGLRYFNVYGPRESHKGDMSSIAYKLHRQVSETGRARLFEGSGGYAAGEQQRDFVWVGDVVDVNLWFWERPECSGIFNVGSGRAQTFNDVARAVLAFHGRGEVEYVPFPDALASSYQSYTCADLARLRAAGYDAPFLTVEEGVERYLEALAR